MEQSVMLAYTANWFEPVHSNAKKVRVIRNFGGGGHNQSVSKATTNVNVSASNDCLKFLASLSIVDSFCCTFCIQMERQVACRYAVPVFE